MAEPVLWFEGGRPRRLERFERMARSSQRLQTDTQQNNQVPRPVEGGSQGKKPRKSHNYVLCWGGKRRKRGGSEFSVEILLFSFRNLTWTTIVFSRQGLLLPLRKASTTNGSQAAAWTRVSVMFRNLFERGRGPPSASLQGLQSNNSRETDDFVSDERGLMTFCHAT